MAILNADYTNLNYETMAKEIGLKPKHMPMLLESFLEEATPSLSAIAEAISSNDLTTLASQAHAIKGSAGNLRLNEVYEMTKDMELSAKENDVSFDYTAHLDAVKVAIATISI